jgi:hypothetical protein
MAKPITNKVKNSKTPVIRKDLDGGVIAEANNDGSIYVDKSVKKGSPLEKEAIAHEKVHLNQMNRGDLNYDDNNVYWKGKAYPRSSMNEGAKNLPWEKEAYDKTKHMKNKKKSAPTKMSDADLVLNNEQTHKKFFNTGESFSEGYGGSEMKNATKKDGISPREERAKAKIDKLKNEIDEINVLDSKSIDTSTEPNTPTRIEPLKMKATPITLKSRRGYNSPLNYNSPLKDNGKTTKSERKADPETGLVYDYTYTTTTTNKNVDKASGPYDVSAVGYDGPKDPNIYNVLGKEISSGFAKRKYGYEGDDVYEYEKLKLKGKDKGKGGGSNESSSETSSETSETRKPVMVTDPAKPGKLNAGFYTTKNIRLAEKHDNKIKNEKIRKAGRKYVRNAKMFGEPILNAKGQEVKGKDLRKLKRRGINPETAKPFADQQEMLEYDKKFDRTNQTLINKRGPGTQKTTRQMTAEELQANKDKRNSNTQGPVKSGYKFSYFSSPDGEYKTINSPNKMKTPFKMGGFGSKKYNN